METPKKVYTTLAEKEADIERLEQELSEAKSADFKLFYRIVQNSELTTDAFMVREVDGNHWNYERVFIFAKAEGNYFATLAEAEAFAKKVNALFATNIKK